ncbi:hypothetical protein [Micromonospora echinofusca]|uniref:hypothetical protein n=1 Tax=Micromonospora echinofusca TaxID=47858 RepID=UPI001AD6A61F|nr:hypothetical protein [Micromonospora echinofusca]
MSQTILPAGLRPTGPARAGVCGTWWPAVAPDGAERGVLRLHPTGTDPGTGQRIAAANHAVAALHHSGLPAPGDPVRHDGALWLVAPRPARPTLLDLAQGGSAIDIGAVAAVAAETAQSLAVLHAAGLGHGAVHGQTVTVTAIGAVTLVETAILPALQAVPGDPAADRRAWADLVRWLTGQWGRPGAAVDLLLRCAAQGEHDLGAAVRTLRDESALLPPGFRDRSALVAAVAAHLAAPPAEPTTRLTAPPAEPTQRLAVPSTDATQAVPTQLMTPQAEPTQRIATPQAEPTQRIASPQAEPTQRIATPDPTAVIGSPATSAVPTSYGPPTDLLAATSPATPVATGVPTATAGSTPTGRYEPTGPTGPTGPAGPPPGGEIRFGPGVPPPPTAPAWRAQPPPPARPRRSVWRVVSSVLSALLTLALLAAVGLYLWQRLSPLEVTSVSVAVPQPPGNRCDITVDVVATVRTNGRAGTITYQWLRTGATPSNLLTEQVGRGQRTVELHLKWSFSGVGTTRETATINITTPSPVQGATSFVYDCRP